jgi:hypothetical protein
MLASKAMLGQPLSKNDMEIAERTMLVKEIHLDKVLDEQYPMQFIDVFLLSFTNSLYKPQCHN